MTNTVYDPPPGRPRRGPANLMSVTYVGERASVGKEYRQRRYIFKYGQPVMVPDEFAKMLIESLQFVRTEAIGKPLMTAFPNGGRLLVRRWGALGDLLMFRAAVSALVRRYPKFQPALRCQDRFSHIFRADPLWHGIYPIGSSFAGAFAGSHSFDQVAEADHRGSPLHRVELFLKAMTDEQLVVTREDWKIPIPNDVRMWVENHLSLRNLMPNQRSQRLIAVQVRGSAAMKSLPRAVMRDLVLALIHKLDVQIILIEESQDEANTLMVDDNVYSMAHRDALHGIEMMRHIDLAITMDSGALWMAHCAPCPVLCILGPTRPEQRITFHPDYPVKARSVSLNDIIACPACFEAAQACNQTYRCMQNQPNWSVVIDKIVQEAGAMIKGDVSLTVLP